MSCSDLKIIVIVAVLGFVLYLTKEVADVARVRKMPEIVVACAESCVGRPRVVTYSTCECEP